MANFDVTFQARTTAANPDTIRLRVEELDNLQARLLGRADDLGSSFYDTATQFTDLMAWNIGDQTREELQVWQSAGTAIAYASSMVELWAQYVEDFKTERENQTTEWFDFREAKKAEIPDKYQGDTITASHPAGEGLGFLGDANKCRSIYDQVVSKVSDLEERERANYKAYEDNAEEVADMLRQGPTKENVQALIDAGINSWAFYNIDPSNYTMMVDGQELTEENAQEWAEEIGGYWSGEKPIDERYHELMIMLSMITTNGVQAQQGGTSYREEEMDFLEAFYDALEGEDPNSAGVLGIPTQMEGDHLTDEEREHALGILGDGLLVLSDESLGGSYEDLPRSVRRTAEGPQFYEHGEGEVPYSWVLYQDDARALSDFFRHTDEDLQGGYELSVNLSMSSGSYTHYIGDSDLMAPDDLTPLLDVATRNEDANYYVITGEHPGADPYADHPALGTDSSESGVNYADLGVNYTEEERVKVVEGLFTYEWEDSGEAVGEMIDWIAQDAHSEDEQERTRAGEAAAAFIEMITTTEMHEALTNTGVNVSEDGEEYKNATFTAFNTELAGDLVDVFDAYIYSFAASHVIDPTLEGVVLMSGTGEYQFDSNSFSIGPEERAAYMQYLMGNDDTAAHTVGSVSAYQYLEMEAYLETGDESSAQGAASLYSLLDVALDAEAENRQQDLQDTEDLKEKLYTFGLGQAEKYSGHIPVVGESISKGLGLGSEWIVSQAIDQEISTSPRLTISTEEEDRVRETRLIFLEHVTNSQNTSIDQPPPQEQIDVLVKHGVAEEQPDGSYVFELDRTKWDITSHPGGGMEDVEDAISGALRGTKVSPTNEGSDAESAFDLQGDYWDTHERRFDSVQKHAPR